MNTKELEKSGWNVIQEMPGIDCPFLPIENGKYKVVTEKGTEMESNFDADEWVFTDVPQDELVIAWREIEGK